MNDCGASVSYATRSELSNMGLLHKGESLCCFRDSASVTYGGMLPSGLTLSALRFILSAKSEQSCKQDCETVDFCNSLNILLSSLSCLLSLSLGSLCLLLGNSLRSWCRCGSWRLRLDDGVILRDDGEGDRHDHLTV